MGADGKGRSILKYKEILSVLLLPNLTDLRYR